MQRNPEIYTVLLINKEIKNCKSNPITVIVLKKDSYPYVHITKLPPPAPLLPPSHPFEKLTAHKICK